MKTNLETQAGGLYDSPYGLCHTMGEIYSRNDWLAKLSRDFFRVYA